MTRALALITFKVFPPQMGGQKGVVLFYKHLKGILKVCMAVSKNNEAAPSGWDVQPLLFDNRKTFLNPFNYWKLKKLVQEKQINILIAEHSYAAWLALLLKKTFQIPFIIHSHNIEALRFQQMGRPWWKSYWSYEKWVHKKADHSFFISAEDEAYAVKNFGLDKSKCSVITYGVEAPKKVELSKAAWRLTLGLKGDEKLFYFNGTLDYKPNFDAVLALVHQVAPLLQQSLQAFKIIISGNRAPDALIQLITGNPHFLYAGFVADVQPFYQYADVFLNPVLNCSGIKTKVIEAIAAGCTVVSTQSGAAGIDASVCSDKLLMHADNNWVSFAQNAIQIAQQPKAPTPKAFYDTYLWNNIAEQAAKKMEELALKYDH